MELNVGDDFDGICCLQLILAYDQNVWTSGIPSITAIVKGKKLYDKRQVKKKRDWGREKQRIFSNSKKWFISILAQI